MKPINCPLEKEESYMRCINKDDLSYVDIPVSRGQNAKIFLPLLKKASEYSGDFKVFGGGRGEKKEYHYFALFSVGLEEPQKRNLPGLMRKNGEVYHLTVDRETLKIIHKRSFRSLKRLRKKFNEEYNLK